MANLLQNVYSYGWRTSGWPAGPIFLAGGAAMLYAGLVTLDGQAAVSGLGVTAAAIGAVIASSREGFDFAPRTREVSCWTSRLGLRRQRSSVALQDGDWLSLAGTGERRSVVLCHSSGPPTELFGARETSKARQVGKAMARALKLDVREDGATSAAQPESAGNSPSREVEKVTAEAAP